jgi:hypothetical protein
MSDIDVLAAVVSRQTLDLNVYAGFLLDALAGALPSEYVTVQRRSSLGARLRRQQAPVIAVSVVLGEERFTLSRPDPTAVARSTIGHEVGGIVLKSEPVPLDQWTRRLATALARLADRNQDAATALARIMSMEV